MKRRTLLVHLLLCLLAAVLLFYLAYAFYLRGKREPSTVRQTTNEQAVVYASEKQMKRKLSLFFPQIAKKMKRSYVVPGMQATESLAGEFRAVSMCTSMTPQGMCVTEDYILISAYCYTHRHNSVLYLLDRVTGAYIKTIALAGKAHVGGLAYDSRHRNVWVSGSSNEAAKAVCYTLDSILDYDISAGKPLRSVYNYTLSTIVRNSYLCYADDALLIGLFLTGKESMLEWFYLAENGALRSQISANYNAYHEYVATDLTVSTSGLIQGVAKEGDKLFLSKSCGPYDSVLQIHSFEENKTSFMDSEADVILRLPQKLEQICVADGEVYCLFESEAYAYRAQPALVIDRILVFDLAELMA